jgi:hypothetical protein
MPNTLGRQRGARLTAWLDMPEFDGIDLGESWVLGWTLDSNRLQFQLDVVLVPGHPLYAPPPPDELACYRSGTLLFPEAVEVIGLPSVDDVRPAIGADGVSDYGHLDWLESTESGYRVTGDFGEVLVRSGHPRVILAP